MDDHAGLSASSGDGAVVTRVGGRESAVWDLGYQGGHHGEATDQTASALLGRLPHQGTPAKLVGEPDADSAIKQAIMEYDVPPTERGRLMAKRRD